jgi:hypothetical protein
MPRTSYALKTLSIAAAMEHTFHNPARRNTPRNYSAVGPEMQHKETEERRAKREERNDDEQQDAVAHVVSLFALPYSLFAVRFSSSAFGLV